MSTVIGVQAKSESYISAKVTKAIYTKKILFFSKRRNIYLSNTLKLNVSTITKIFFIIPDSNINERRIKLDKWLQH